MTKPEWNWQLLDRESFPCDILQNAVRRASLPPVILFNGKPGIGKKTVAMLAAALSVCELGTACGQCPDCHAALRGEHPEIKIFAGQDRLTTEIAEELQDHLEIMPQQTRGVTKYRVAVIIDAERMTLAAANRLLKTLEEPHEFARVFLTSAHPAEIPDTILSRCSQITVPPPPLATARRIAQHICDTAITDEQLDSELAACGYAPWKWLEFHEGQHNFHALARQLSEIIGQEQVRMPQILQFCEQHLKNEAPDQVLSAIEVALNENYKNILERGAANSAKILTIKRRRQLLSELWKKAGQQKIHLNSQLTAEALLI